MDSLEKRLEAIGKELDSLKGQLEAESPDSLRRDKGCDIMTRASALGEWLLECERQINRLRAPFRVFTHLRNRIRDCIKPRNLPTPKAPTARIAPSDDCYTIVLAANESYVPYMAVLIQSIITQALTAKAPPPPTTSSVCVSYPHRRL
ncbi:MAG: hypothetical protein K2N12_00040 [Helicobacter sp.]|nr:hypothetical protein [Helicobacter sp.]